MTWSHDAVLAWQKRYAKLPKVYVVVDRNGDFENVYDTKEAAELERQWLRRTGIDRWAKIRAYTVQPLDMAKERWT
ncbi:MAG: hypothetical protein GWN84_27215 [Gammaproteobacteria bacterium]|nr:hypothetical protein [Gammaproteobacteria bacterium]NIR32918.1 hypothetical protein [Gammaproteobacteria bacterium]NIR84716.1 hypothetical protein [Gammaproteobacteria bacterium]NIU07265.1 hypothetical protein [Gammaproteobacteria bacterium]NIV52872.1 hypothetical protein [Gammaproteobacteria bacterium]